MKANIEKPLPCEVGTVVYALYQKPYRSWWHERRCKGSLIHSPDKYKPSFFKGYVEIRKKQFRKAYLNLFGKTVFLTEGEAQAELERRANG